MRSLGPRTSTFAVIVAGALTLTVPAHAEPVTYATDGAAAAGDNARVAALDEAFKAAVREAVAALVAPADRTTHQATLDAEVVRRARLWVASFKVTRERTTDGVLRVEVDVRIDHDKLIARLAELGVPARDPRADGADARPDPDAVAARHATLLLRVATGDGAIATYGAGGEPRHGLALASAPLLATRGLIAVEAPTGGARVRAGDGADGLPLDDGDARALAGEVHADVAVVAGVTVGAIGPVRGTRELGVLARARVRVLDLGAARVVGDADAARGARAPAGSGAAALGDDVARWAMLDALARAVPIVREARVVEPALAAADGEVVVRIAAGGGRDVAARVRAHLADAQGVTAARLRRVGAGGVVLGVVGPRADRVAAILRAAADLAVSAKVVDGEVVVVARSP